MILVGEQLMSGKLTGHICNLLTGVKLSPLEKMRLWMFIILNNVYLLACSLRTARLLPYKSLKKIRVSGCMNG